MGYKARVPRARSTRGRVLCLPYVSYLGWIYVICGHDLCNLCHRFLATVTVFVHVAKETLTVARYIAIFVSP